MLDTVARAANQSGSGLADFVKTQSAAGAKLLQQPKFQVQLVGELTKKGILRNSWWRSFKRRVRWPRMTRMRR